MYGSRNLPHAPRLPFPLMSTEKSSLGACPFCNGDVPPGNVLIEYEKDGETAVYAECPSCEEPVHPE